MHRFSTAAAAALVVLAGAAPASSVAVAAPPTSTALVLSTTTSSVGQTVTARATVTATPGPAEGDVVISVDGTTISANLGGNGTSTVVLPASAVGEHAVSATFVPLFPANQERSASPAQTWTVTKVRSRLQVRVIGKGARIPTSVQVKAAGDWGTTPTGRVTMEIRRIASGTVARKARTLSGAGVVLADFGRLRKGSYRLAVSYVGDADHLAVRHFERFAVVKR